jgi:hypothetical protein
VKALSDLAVGYDPKIELADEFGPPRQGRNQFHGRFLGCAAVRARGNDAAQHRPRKNPYTIDCA